MEAVPEDSQETQIERGDDEDLQHVSGSGAIEMMKMSDIRGEPGTESPADRGEPGVSTQPTEGVLNPGFLGDEMPSAGTREDNVGQEVLKTGFEEPLTDVVVVPAENDRRLREERIDVGTVEDSAAELSEGKVCSKHV